MATKKSPRKRPVKAIKKWLVQIQHTLEKQTMADAALYWGRKKSSEAPFNYRLEHTRAVVAIALDLAKTTRADKDIVLAAAWLHDIGKLERGKDSGRHHGLVGAKMAREILRRTDFPHKKIPAVVDAISQHVGLFKEHKVEPLTSAIIWDADKLSKLGATGTAINMLYKPAYHLNRFGAPPTLADVLEDHAEWNGIGVKIVKSLNLAASRKIGRKRLKFLKRFYEQLQNEQTGRR